MRLSNPVKGKKIKEPVKIRKVFIIHPTFLYLISIHVLAVKCKLKIDYFHFFMNITLSGHKSQIQSA